MSTVDKVKNALHLNKDHSTPSTTHNTGNTVPEGTSGPHTSRVANAADPRIDSDLDNSRTAETSTHDTSGTAGGYTGTGTGVTGTNGGISHSTNSGPHSSNLANKADPMVDSDLDGRGNRQGAATGGIIGTSGSHATPGSGTAQNTAGPHNSDTMNKLDPRVDSDLSGGKTYGGNQTHAGTTPQLDAAQVPPSVFAAHHGEPEILHDVKTHDRAKRHSVVSHQEQLSGV